jgi:hypothetical protein
VLADHVGVGAERDAAAQDAAASVALAQRAQRELQHLGDLGLGRQPGLSRLDEPHEGVDGVVGGDGRRRLQGAEELDAAGIEADLLLRLAQRRGAQVGVLGVLAAAGERDLAGVAPEVVAPPGQDDVRLVADEEERNQDGRVGAAVDVEGRRLDRVEEDVAQAIAQVSSRE